MVNLKDYIGKLVKTAAVREVRYSGYAGNPFMFVPIGVWLRVVNTDSSLGLLVDFYVEDQWTPEHTYDPVTKTYPQTGRWLTRHSAWYSTSSDSISEIFSDGLRFLTMIPLCQSPREARQSVKELPLIDQNDLFMKRHGPYSWEMKRESGS